MYSEYQIKTAIENKEMLLEWDQKPFYRALELKYFGHHLRFEDLEKGYVYYMSQNLFNSKKNEMKIVNWIIAGKWKFCKRGTEVFLEFISSD